MKVLKLIFISFFFLLISFSAISQTDQKDEPKPSLNSGTIENQFNYLYKKSGSYQEYKVVKKVQFHKIKANVLDSLKLLKNELSETKNLVDIQNSEINNLKTDLKTTNDNLTNVTKEKDSIKFLGIPLTKSAYNGLLWSLIIGLILLLVLFIFKFKNSNTITKQANLSLVETEEEFDTFRARSLEREQKIRRELQDEINKHKNTTKGKKEK